jgi:hypothetical protein
MRPLDASNGRMHEGRVSELLGDSQMGQAQVRFQEQHGVGPAYSQAEFDVAHIGDERGVADGIAEHFFFNLLTNW